MAEIIRLLWRLDYPYEFGVLEKRGQIARAIMTEVENFWGNGGSGAIPDSLAATYVSKTESRNISVETTSINGTFEWMEGRPFETILGSREFKSINKIVQKVLDLSGVINVSRAGVRFIVLERSALDRVKFRRLFRRLVSNPYVVNGVAELGPVTDFGLVLEGTADDTVSYRMQMGLNEEKNIRMILPQNIGDEAVSKLCENDLFFDIDLYEMNFSFREHQLFRWASTKFDKAKAFVTKCQSIVEG